MTAVDFDRASATGDVAVALLRASLGEFFRAGWHVLEPSTPLVDNWHIDCLCDHIQATLEDWIRRQQDPGYTMGIRNLLFNVPPGTAKSRILGVYTLPWMWLRWPEFKAIYFSANPRVALRDSVYCRIVIESPWYQRTFGQTWQLSEDQNTKGLFRNTAGGFRQAVGITAKITGDRGDGLFVDDPNDPEEVLSEAARAEVNNRWDYAIANRLNDLRTSIRIGIMQRVHEDDWSGHVLAQGDWEHICLPQEYEPHRAVTTAIGWRDPRTVEGELLFPERFPPEVLAKEKRRLGTWGYSGQHQQSPTPSEGGKFSQSWLRRWSAAGESSIILNRGDGLTDRIELRDCNLFCTSDSACSTKTSADYTVFSVWAHHRGFAVTLLLDNHRARLVDPDAIHLARRIKQRWTGIACAPLYFVVEENGVGLPRMQTMQRAGLSVKGVRVSSDKWSRSQIAAVRMEAGQLYIPAPGSCTWLHNWEHEILMFPNGRYDDQVDCLSLAMHHVDGIRDGDFLRPGPRIEVPRKRAGFFGQRDPGVPQRRPAMERMQERIVALSMQPGGRKLINEDLGRVLRKSNRPRPFHH
jgi:predicted phage terminase large subunit-like protein